MGMMPEVRRCLKNNTSPNKSGAWNIDSTTNKKNPYEFHKVLTFKWHVSKFEPNQIISLQITVI